MYVEDANQGIQLKGNTMTPSSTTRVVGSTNGTDAAKTASAASTDGRAVWKDATGFAVGLARLRKANDPCSNTHCLQLVAWSPVVWRYSGMVFKSPVPSNLGTNQALPQNLRASPSNKSKTSRHCHAEDLLILSTMFMHQYVGPKKEAKGTTTNHSSNTRLRRQSL